MANQSLSPMSDRSSADFVFAIPCRQSSVSTDSETMTTPSGADEKDTSETDMLDTHATKRKRKPVPGKGFNKSRRGCFNCKRRRVKCSEVKPECRGCSRMGLICVYPENPSPTPSKSRISTASNTKLGVNLDHLRFFRHFLLEAYPPAPHGAEPVWHNVAALSHEACIHQAWSRSPF